MSDCCTPGRKPDLKTRVAAALRKSLWLAGAAAVLFGLGWAASRL